MGIHENKATVNRFDRLTAALELDALDEICTPDMINHALASHRRAGLDGTKQFLRECQVDPGKAAWMRAMMSGQQLVMIADGDYVIQHVHSVPTPDSRARATTAATSPSSL